MPQKIRTIILLTCSAILGLSIGATITFSAYKGNNNENIPAVKKIVLEKHHLLGFVTSIEGNTIHVQDVTQKIKSDGTHTVLTSPQTRFSYRLAGNSLTQNYSNNYITGNLSGIRDGFYVYITTLDDPIKTTTITPVFIVYSIYPFENTYAK